VTLQLVQKHRYCLFASQPDHEKVYSKLEYVAQICREAMQKRGRDKGVWLWQEAMEPLLEHEGTTRSQVDRIRLRVLALLHWCFYHTFWPCTSTTFCHLYHSSALHLGISRLSIPALCTLFYGLVGLQTGNICVFAPAAGSPHPLLIQATWWDSLT